MTDERYKKIMADLGMPNSHSLLAALKQVANEVAQEQREQRLQVGDYFTHDRTGTRFVCRSVTKHDYDGMESVVRAEVDLAAL